MKETLEIDCDCEPDSPARLAAVRIFYDPQPPADAVCPSIENEHLRHSPP